MQGLAAWKVVGDGVDSKAMRTLPKLLVVVLLVAGCGAPPQRLPRPGDEALATDAERFTRLDDLPRQFDGTFTWEGAPYAQKLRVTIERVELVDRGRVWEATGRAVYLGPPRETNIDVRARIEPDTRRVELWESNPDQASFVTDGSHVGKISADFRRIEAEWHGGSGGTGQLVLVAPDE